TVAPQPLEWPEAGPTLRCCDNRLLGSLHARRPRAQMELAPGEAASRKRCNTAEHGYGWKCSNRLEEIYALLRCRTAHRAFEAGQLSTDCRAIGQVCRRKHGLPCCHRRSDVYWRGRRSS